jgi:hypothetical protein
MLYSFPVCGKIRSLAVYKIKFVSDNFFQVLWFPPPGKTDHYDTNEILLKVALNIHNNIKTSYDLGDYKYKIPNNLRHIIKKINVID